MYICIMYIKYEVLCDLCCSLELYTNLTFETNSFDNTRKSWMATFQNILQTWNLKDSIVGDIVIIYLCFNLCIFELKYTWT